MLRSVRNTQAIKLKPFRSVENTQVSTVKTIFRVLGALKLSKLKGLRSVRNTEVVAVKNIMEC